MPNGSDSLLALLGEKRRIFTEYERVTEEMLNCEVDDIPARMDRRGELMKRCQELNARIEAACAGDAALRNAARGKGEPGDPAAQEGLEIRAAADRIGLLDQKAAKRFERERDALRDKIKENNRSVGAQASRFFSGAGGSARPPRAGGFKKI